jgi:hypothetical protein
MAKLKGNVNDLVVTKPRPLVEKLEEVDLERSPNCTYIGLCLDSSGSMTYHQDDAMRGFNNHLATIRKTAEHDVFTWLTLFGTPDGIETPIERGAIGDLYDLSWRNYRPYGSTPLLDAIGHTHRLLAVEDMGVMAKDQAFLVIAFSDGQENASLDWDWNTLRGVVMAKDRRWTFVFVGPRQEQHRFAKAGYKPENMLDWDDTTCSTGTTPVSGS